MASLDTGRYRMEHADHRRKAVEHVRRLQAQARVVMVQPYVTRIDDEGETALVFLSGEFSHAVRKRAVLTGPDEGVDRRFLPQGGLDLKPCQPSATEFQLAHRVLAAVPGGGEELLYARVDLVPGEDGSPVLLELELTEPQLYFASNPSAAWRMAAAVAARGRGSIRNRSERTSNCSSVARLHSHCGNHSILKHPAWKGEIR